MIADLLEHLEPIKKRLRQDPARTSARAIWQGLDDDRRANIVLGGHLPDSDHWTAANHNALQAATSHVFNEHV